MTTDSLASPAHTDYTRPSGCDLYPSGRSAIPNYVFCCGNAFNEEGCHCHLAFLVSQVSGPILAMSDREKGLSPPTVLLFGESFLNSSLDDTILSLCERWARICHRFSLSLKPETRLVVIYPGLACCQLCRVSKLKVRWLRPARSGHCP
jgi:hypothetical protein